MLNKCFFIGNVGKDPEIRYTQNNEPVANFSIAVTEKYKDNERTEWVRLVAFKGIAGVIEKYVSKGSKLHIEAKLQTRSYEKDGQTHYMTEFVVQNMVMLGGKNENTSDKPVSEEQPFDDSIPF